MNSLPDELGDRLRKSLDAGPAPELSTDLVTGAPHRAAPKLTDPRRNIQLAGGVAAVVAVLTVVALVVVPGVGRAPLFTAAASASELGATSASEPTSGLMRIWADYRYHAGAGLSTSGGTGQVYQLTLPGSGSDRARSLAAVFGLSGIAITGPGTVTNGSGTVTSSNTPGAVSPEWTVGSSDGTSPSLDLTWSGTGEWWFNNPTANPAEACPPTIGAGGGSTGAVGGGSGEVSGSSSGSTGSIAPTIGGPVVPPVCVAAPVPAGPSKAPAGAQARAQAQKLFASTGLDVAADDIQLTSDSFQTTATANLVVGGVATALRWGVTWSNAGPISSAYGQSVAVVSRGSFHTISPSDAVARLSDSRWFGSAGPPYQDLVRVFAADGAGSGASSATGVVPLTGTVATPPTPVPAPSATGAPTPLPTALPTGVPTGSPTAVPTAVPTASPTAVPVPEPTVTGPPVTGPPVTGPPVIDVTVTKAEPTLLLLSDSTGGSWLVPGYAMQVQDSQWMSVVSLVPGVIQLPVIPTAQPGVIAP